VNRREAAAAVGTLGVLALAGCGGDDEPAAPRFSVREVQTRVRELTGVTPERIIHSDGVTTLRLAPGEPEDGPVGTRYAGVTIDVFDDPAEADRARRRAGGPTDEKDNVLVRGSFGDGLEAFGRIVPVVRSLGLPASSAQLQPADVLCSRAGIDPDGGRGKYGTCLDRSQNVTVVPAEGRLRLSGVEVSRPTVRAATVLTSRRFGRVQRIRAQGVFLLVTARMQSTSTAPYLPDTPNLVVDGRRYASDDRDSLFATDPRLFPLDRPGARATAVFLFDVPKDAYDPTAGAALEFALGRDGTQIAFAPAVGRIRLPLSR
jgi:hypothetical protein